MFDELLDVVKEYAQQCVKIHFIAFCIEFAVQTVVELVNTTF